MKHSILILASTVCLHICANAQIIQIPADHATIQAGIDLANEGDTVLVSEGSYLENINFNGKAISVASRFILDGDTSHISKTIIDGSQPISADTASTVLMISGEDSTSALIGFTITGGSGTMVEDVKVIPTETRFKTGGGVLIIDGGGRIEHNIISDNSIGPGYPEYVPDGGGIGIVISESERSNEKTLLIQHNYIVNNQVLGDQTGGGGLHLFVGNAPTGASMNILIQKNIIDGNSNTHSGSGTGTVGAGMVMGFALPVRNGDYIVSNNIISHNRIMHTNTSWKCGGGIYVYYTGSGKNSNPSPLICNNIITDNDSQSKGGGLGVYYWSKLSVDNINPRPIIFNNTITNNRSPSSSGLFVTNSKPIVVNNIFWNEKRLSTSKEFVSDKGEIVAHNNNIRGIVNDTAGNYNYDPGFIGASHELDKYSANIGRGTDSIEYGGKWYVAPTYDFYGNPRPHPVDNFMDIGAIESSFEKSVFIPDTAFLHALIEDGVDSNGDGQISYEEAEAITDLDVDSSFYDRGSIFDMTGVEAFVNLVSLHCYGNQLTSLDISNNTELEYLQCGANYLTRLDLSNNTRLTELYCKLNELTNLNVSNNNSLTEVRCWGNQLTTLDFSNNTALTSLSCSGNKLTSLDVSNCTALKSLNCDDNQLTSLDVTACIALTTLSCDNNQFASLDVTACTALTRLSCGTNQLTSLDVSKNTALTSLSCNGNLLSGLDVSSNTTLDYLNCVSNQLTSLDMSNNTALDWLSCSNNQLTSLDVSACAALTRLDCGENQLSSLDVSNNTALLSLSCNGNQLFSLDLSNHYFLDGLNCSNNKLTSLDLSDNYAIDYLNCSNNQLTSLDVSNIINLEGLACSNNRLTSLDVSNNIHLKYLLCGTTNDFGPWGYPTCDCQDTANYSNKLTSLDVSACKELVKLDCSSNPISNLDLSNNDSLIWLCLCSMDSLNQVCVSTMPFPPDLSPDGFELDTTGSPKVYFTTECTIGIEEQSLSGLLLYPNPSNGILTIEANNPEKYSIEIHSLNGQLIHSSNMNGTSQKIDLSSFRKGVYLITIRSAYFVTKRKVVKL